MNLLELESLYIRDGKEGVIWLDFRIVLLI
jgi:hypothetical protein